MVEKQYPRDSAVIAGFSREQKLEALVPREVTRCLTEDGYVETPLDGESLSTAVRFQNSWIVQHVTLRH